MCLGNLLGLFPSWCQFTVFKNISYGFIDKESCIFPFSSKMMVMISPTTSKHSFPHLSCSPRVAQVTLNFSDLSVCFLNSGMTGRFQLAWHRRCWGLLRRRQTRVQQVTSPALPLIYLFLHTSLKEILIVYPAYTRSHYR